MGRRIKEEEEVKITPSDAQKSFKVPLWEILSACKNLKRNLAPVAIFCGIYCWMWISNVIDNSHLIELIDFEFCGIYWKKREMNLMSGKF